MRYAGSLQSLQGSLYTASLITLEAHGVLRSATHARVQEIELFLRMDRKQSQLLHVQAVGDAIKGSYRI